MDPVAPPDPRVIDAATFVGRSEIPRAIAYAAYPGLPPTAAEEVAEHMSARAIEVILRGQFDPDGGASVGTWLHGFCRRLVLDRQCQAIVQRHANQVAYDYIQEQDAPPWAGETLPSLIDPHDSDEAILRFSRMTVAARDTIRAKALSILDAFRIPTPTPLWEPSARQELRQHIDSNEGFAAETLTHPGTDAHADAVWGSIPEEQRFKLTLPNYARTKRNQLAATLLLDACTPWPRPHVNTLKTFVSAIRRIAPQDPDAAGFAANAWIDVIFEPKSLYDHTSKLAPPRPARDPAPAFCAASRITDTPLGASADNVSSLLARIATAPPHNLHIIPNMNR
jgi:hypothetical protein